MSAQKLKRGLTFKKARLSLYELNGKVWILSSEVGGAIGRDAEYLVSQASALFTSKLTVMARISDPAVSSEKQPRGHKRRLLSIVGARTVCAMAPTLSAMGLFYLLAKLDSQGRPKAAKGSIRNGR
jgi:hypothetical protein